MTSPHFHRHRCRRPNDLACGGCALHASYQDCRTHHSITKAVGEGNLLRSPFIPPSSLKRPTSSTSLSFISSTLHSFPHPPIIFTSSIHKANSISPPPAIFTSSISLIPSYSRLQSTCLPTTAASLTSTRDLAPIPRVLSSPRSYFMFSLSLALTRYTRTGNHYCSRDYGSSAPNTNSYHYSNT